MGCCGAQGLGPREQAALASRDNWSLLQVFGDKDADGFYRGEGDGRMGYVPCNMVAEVAVDSPVERQQLFQRGYLSPDVLSEGSGMTCGCPVPTSPTHPPPPTQPLLSNWYVQGGREPHPCRVQQSLQPCRD